MFPVSQRGRTDTPKLRAWWWTRQGLDGDLAGKSAAAILGRAGWARSVGGANPYVTLHARGGIGRAAADAAAATLEIHELPSARGCTCVLLWRANPLASFRLSAGEGHVEPPRRFFGWIGPATAAAFQGFSGLGVKAAKAAMEALNLEPARKDSAR